MKEWSKHQINENGVNLQEEHIGSRAKLSSIRQLFPPIPQYGDEYAGKATISIMLPRSLPQGTTSTMTISCQHADPKSSLEATATCRKTMKVNLPPSVRARRPMKPTTECQVQLEIGKMPLTDNVDCLLMLVASVQQTLSKSEHLPINRPTSIREGTDEVVRMPAYFSEAGDTGPTLDTDTR